MTQLQTASTFNQLDQYASRTCCFPLLVAETVTSMTVHTHAGWLG